MTGHEKDLLARAVEACRARGVDLSVSHIPGEFWYEDEGGITGFGEAGEPDADALIALLTDLGEPVPERPSADGLRELALRADANGWRYLREFAARDKRGPMYVAALIEGGEA